VKLLARCRWPSGYGVGLRIGSTVFCSILLTDQLRKLLASQAFERSRYTQKWRCHLIKRKVRQAHCMQNCRCGFSGRHGTLRFLLFWGVFACRSRFWYYRYHWRACNLLLVYDLTDFVIDATLITRSLSPSFGCLIIFYWVHRTE